MLLWFGDIYEVITTQKIFKADFKERYNMEVCLARHSNSTSQEKNLKI